MTPAGESTLPALVRYFLRLGTLGFGGPVALVGQMERELVAEKGWLTKEQMREAIAVCQSLPGPLAIQVGVFIAYLRGGFWGAWAGGWAFILPNFLIVTALAAAYVHFGGLQPVTAIFYGVSPAVIALILHSCYRLAKLGMEDRLQWFIAVACFLVTVILQSEVALLFLGAGTLGVFYYGTALRKGPSATAMIVAAPAVPIAKSTLLLKILLFFLKAGALTFGSGLVIVPFLQQGIVQEHGWLGEREFLVAVAIGMISPGPVVITATFVGYLVAGFWGAVAATIGIFLPSFILVLVAAPVLARHRANRNVQGFIKGAYAAAIGTILGACVLLGRIAIGDWLTVLIGAISLAILFRWKVSNPLLIAAAAGVGLIAYPLLHPAWVMAGDSSKGVSPPPLSLESKISLGPVRGRIDHLAIDIVRRRLYVAELANNTVDVVDLDHHRVLQTITGFHEPQGIAYEPSSDTLFVANGGDGTVQIVQASTLVRIGQIALGEDADNVRNGPVEHRVLVGYGDGGIAVIDPVSRQKVRDIPLRAHPESFQIDSGAKRIYVNVPGAHQIAVIDSESGTSVNSLALGALLGNFPMAIDIPAHQLDSPMRSLDDDDVDAF